MKFHLLLLLFYFIFSTTSAQKVTLAIRQDYVIPEMPKITQNGDTLKSSSPIGNQWFKNGVEIVGENKQKLILSNSGNYKVAVTLGSGCSTESTTYSAVKTDVPIIQTVDFKCMVFPNPNNGMFTIELESDRSEIFDLELFTSNGESVVKKSIKHSSGTQQIPFGKTSLANGVYYLQINHGANYLSRQIVVN